MRKFPVYIASWKDIDEWAEPGAMRMLEDGWVPDVVVGVARGGWVAARIYCDYLGVKDLVSVKVEHWGVTATPDGKAKLRYGTSYSMEGKRVLVVDDISDTGESLTLVKRYIEEQKPREVRVATLLTIKGSRFRPDYYGREIDWAWIVFPWNFIEDVINLVGGILEEKGKASTDELLRTIEELHGACPDREKFEKAMRVAEMRGVFRLEDGSWVKAQ
ncbi:MAG: phosphoribosyltransferase [Thermococci archaeon]|nr:phosphoribosyltransferase [Thermococci archaeon]